MTAFGVPVRLIEDRTPPALPWRRMVWVTWRQHRFALGSACVFLGAVAVALSLLGSQLHHAYAAAVVCHPATSARCAALVTRFNGMDDFLANGSMLQVVPPLVGAFVGTAVLARELESGAFRFSFTQGFGRWRWTLAKLVALGVVVAALAGAFSMVTTWYFEPYFGAENQALTLSSSTPFAAGLFGMRGITLATWTLVAFALGGVAGVLIRRVVLAIGATLGAYAALAFVTGGFLRQRYLAPLLSHGANLPTAAWIVRQWGTKDGRLAWVGFLPPLHLLRPNCPPPGAPGVRVPKPSAQAFLQCLPRHAGYALWTSYQPASRFWPFQWIEAGWLTLLSALLIVGAAWLVRRTG